MVYLFALFLSYIVPLSFMAPENRMRFIIAYVVILYILFAFACSIFLLWITGSSGTNVLRDINPLYLSTIISDGLKAAGNGNLTILLSAMSLIYIIPIDLIWYGISLNWKAPSLIYYAAQIFYIWIFLRLVAAFDAANR